MNRSSSRRPDPRTLAYRRALPRPSGNDSKRGPKYSRKSVTKDKFWLRKSIFKKFGPSVLGLENILAETETFEALAVVVDLKDFTAFCDQRDPHLVVPRFIKSFLEWLFEKLQAELLIEEAGNEVVLLSHLPFFGKFLGDGVLLLWDVTDMHGEAKRNIVYSFDIICSDYQVEFMPSIKKTASNAPPKLRCGIAQGQVTSIAGGRDFVGLCINIASRLQKLGDGAFCFAFTQKGLEPESENWYENFRLIRIPVRGISNDELVYVLKTEFRELPKDVKSKYRWS
jgi:class 3 adenylate cyclase